VHQGFAAVVEPLATVSLDDLLDQPEPLPPTLVVLDQVEDPRNVGAIVRLAAAFRAGAVIVQDRHAPSFSGALAKAASGGLETVPLVRVVNIARALADLNDAGYTCLGLDAEAPLPLAAAMPNTPVALVFGSEGRGLRRLVRERCQRLASIPMDPAIESLNVAAAAAIALYERARCLDKAEP
jgi:rRNA methylases